MADRFEYLVATLIGKKSMSMVPQTKFMVFFIKAPKGNYSHKGSIITFRRSKNMASFHNIVVQNLMYSQAHESIVV